MISTTDTAVIGGNCDAGVLGCVELCEIGNKGSPGLGTSQTISRAQKRDELGELLHGTPIFVSSANASFPETSRLLWV